MWSMLKSVPLEAEAQVFIFNPLALMSTGSFTCPVENRQIKHRTLAMAHCSVNGMGVLKRNLGS